MYTVVTLAPILGVAPVLSPPLLTENPGVLVDLECSFHTQEGWLKNNEVIDINLAGFYSSLAHPWA